MMRLRSVIIFIMLLASGLTSLAGPVYVSSSTGLDTNSGLSPDNPVQTIASAMKLGKEVLLKSGDIFYGPAVCYGRTLSRYGDGPNPVVCGYKRIAGQRWKRVSLRIWRLDLLGDGFTGAGVSDEPSMLNNIGCIHEYDKDLVHGRKVQYRKDMKQDWDIWQVEEAHSDMDPAAFNAIYLYSKRNPNRMKLELSVGDAALRTDNAVVEGVDFVGFGFGISGGTNTQIRNCSIDAMGGMIQVGYPHFVCYGNGIEFYISRDMENCLVENCSVSRCYDAGMTIQGSGFEGATPKNIVIRHNVISHCCQGWEDFLRNGEGVVFEGCRFVNNIIIGSGDSGFGYADGRFKYCNVLGNNYAGDTGMIIENNIFVGGNFYCSGAFRGKYTSHNWKNNTCYLVPGSFVLSDYTGARDVLRVNNDNKDQIIQQYRTLTGDNTTEFILVEEDVPVLLAKMLTNDFFAN